MELRISAFFTWVEDFAPPKCPAELLSGLYGLSPHCHTVPSILQVMREGRGAWTQDGCLPSWVPPCDRQLPEQLLLVDAASMDWVDGVRQLLECGVDASVRLAAPGDSRAGTIALHYALTMGALAAARYLFSLGYAPSPMTRRHVSVWLAQEEARSFGILPAEVRRWKCGEELIRIARLHDIASLRSWPAGSVEQVDLDMALMQAIAGALVHFADCYPVPDLLELERPEYETCFFEEDADDRRVLYSLLRTPSVTHHVAGILLRLGASPRAFRSSGLRIASRVRLHDVARLLLDAGADPEEAGLETVV